MRLPINHKPLATPQLTEVECPSCPITLHPSHNPQSSAVVDLTQVGAASRSGNVTNTGHPLPVPLARMITMTPQVVSTHLPLPHEGAFSPRAIVAQNLLFARSALELTQQELADASGISRATIAQLEAGVGDPRLSTLELLAATLHVPAHFLLLDQAGFRAIAELSQGGPPAINHQHKSGEDVTRVLRVGGALSRLRAASLGVDAAREAGLTGEAHRVGAAIGAARFASRGVSLGAQWAELLERFNPVPTAHTRALPGDNEFDDGDGI
jgi:transcriptional regulator with XRE-family HTH domain